MIIITCPSITEHDAISNDVVQQCDFFRSIGIRSEIFAGKYGPTLENRALSYSSLLEYISDPRNILIYHHGVYWTMGLKIIKQAKCKIYLKYHNITPIEFFERYDKKSAFATKMGRKQTAQLVQSGKFDKYLGDSQYNINELIELGVPQEQCEVIPPFHCVHEFDNTQLNRKLLDEQLDGKINVLFVGRVVPNKGHKHLIRTIARYVHFYDTNIRLNIVGNIENASKKYIKELKSEIEEAHLNQVVHFRQKVSFEDLHTYYASSHVFLVLSEHEGFCVPILEAQYHKLPIIALGCAAVGETVGTDQLVYPDLDYDFFACAIHKVATSPNLRSALANTGLQNFKKYETSELQLKTRKTLDISEVPSN